MTNYVENILACYRRASVAERNEGMTWYSDAHALALELSPGDPWRGAGVIAAFSPMKKWALNVTLARRAFETGVASGHTSMMNGFAQRILDGEHALDVLKGDKTRAFCASIATNGVTDVVTIDRHAHDVAMAQVFTDKTRNIGKVKYRAMSEAYRIAAEKSSLPVAQMQAIVWVRWINEKASA